ncbi:TetR/AcrR family transcriptional regulator [Cellulomonas fulva]|uniref:TetR/AcrR family transcriptional regulator n=1 Tax=Cellulomonas fulva TaxID=2835530 RepID=UPI0027DB0310|nr:TetR/AcrR family transcriptional regulator [Cellulomonas fulva]
MSTSTPPSAALAVRRGRSTREDILEAAVQLFGQVGYRTASLREIASRVGISHPGLLHHFPSKAALLAAVLARRDEVDLAASQADRAAGLPVAEVFARVVERNAARPGIVELFATLSAEATAPDHPAHAYFRERYTTVLAELTADFAELDAAGRLCPGVTPESAARRTVAVMDGLQVQWLLEADRPGTRVDMAAEIRAFYATLAPDPEAS